MTGTLTNTRKTRPALVYAILLLILGLRFWTMTLPGYPPDLSTYKSWSFEAGLRGIHTLYDGHVLFDYPPLYGYLLAPVGKLFSWLYPPETFGALNADPSEVRESAAQASERQAARRRAMVALNVLVKTPPLVFDGLVAVLLGLLVARHRLWGAIRSWQGWRPALIYLGLPGIMLISGYWGQPDAVETFFCLLALYLILLRKPELGWISAAMGLLMKPLAAPLFPLLVLATLMKCGWRRLLSGGFAGLAAGLIGFLPFLLTGRTELLIDRLVRDIDAMPYTSVNGHNFWWLTGAWRPATEPLIGFLTPKAIGLTLFLVAYAGVLLWVWKRERLQRSLPKETSAATHSGSAPVDLGSEAHWFLAGGAVFLSFFVWSTHMHENHLFPAIPFFLLLAGRSKRWLWIAVTVSTAVFINSLTHDLIIGDLFLSKIGGETHVFAPDIQWYLNLPSHLRTDWTLTRTPYESGLEATLAYGNSIVVMLTWGWVAWLMAKSWRRNTASPC